MSSDDDWQTQTSGERLVDAYGRTTLLRGASLHCKYPRGLPSHEAEGFLDHRQLSFVGRPFPLEDADEHLQRLSRMGFNCLRLLVPWEAIEHESPGLYDEDYMEYVKQLVEKMRQWGLRCIIDAHQDLFSRLLGGSGAPGWTVELAGFDLSNLDQALAAHRHCYNLEKSDPPPSVWPSGLQKLATATMFTLFFGGDDFAPSLRIPASTHAQPDFAFGKGASRSDIGIGTFLRQSMIAAYLKLAQKLADAPNLIGIEPMNEPHSGYIGLHSFHTWDDKTDLAFCYFPSAFQGMVLGAGHSQKVPFYVRSWPEPTKIGRYEVINPSTSVWRNGECIWGKEGVWTWDSVKNHAVLLRSSYFEVNPVTGKAVDFYKDYWFPFIKEFGDAIHSTSPQLSKWLIFAGAVPNEYPPEWPQNLQPRNLVYSPHFYDLHTLFCKTFGNLTYNVQALSRGQNPLTALHFGRNGVNENYAKQTRNLKAKGLPNYFSEIGTTFEANLPPNHIFSNSNVANSKRKHKSARWYTRQIDALLNAMDACASGYALWLYNPENDAKDALQLGPRGDGWNGEDFSFVYTSKGKVGFRALDAIVRPYPINTAGVDLTFNWDMFTLDFDLSFADSKEIRSKSTTVFLPSNLYANGQLSIKVSDGQTKYNKDTQILAWTHSEVPSCDRHSLNFRVKDSPEVARRQAQSSANFHWTAVLVPTLFALLLVSVSSTIVSAYLWLRVSR